MRSTILLLTVATLLIPPFPATAEEWTTADTAREAAFVGLVFLDWQQTRWSLKRGAAEQNPVIGPHPSQARLDAMVTGAVVGHAAASLLLPNPWRRWWQHATIVVEISAVTSNAVVLGGLRFSF